MASKDELRKQILEIRHLIPEPSHQLRSAAICEVIESFLEDQDYTSIHGYLPFRKEVDILPLLKKLYRDDKQIVTSIIGQNGEMNHVEFDPNGELTIGKFGVPFPMLYTPFDENPDVILVPGVLFDQNGNRIGYGGGYYDRFLKDQDRAIKIGVCFVEQCEIDLPVEEFDQSVDIVISD